MSHPLTAPLILLLGLLPMNLATQAPAAPSPGTGTTPPAAAPAAVEEPPPAPAAGGGSEVELVAVPFPELDALEESVAAQLAEVQGVLAWAFNRPSPDRAELAEAFGELGRHYHAYGLDEAAAACYENARRLAPAEFRWPYYLGVLQQGRGRHAEAVAAYVNAMTLGSSSVTTLYRLAEIFLAEDRRHEARVLLEKVLTTAPDLPAAFAALGEVALAEERWADAVAYFEQALAQVPQADRLHYPLGLAYRGLGETDRAQRHLQQAGAIGVRPPDPLIDQLEGLKTGERVYLLRGQQAFRAGDYAAAAAAFRQAVAAAPESATARVNLGSALGQLGDREGAEAEYRQALAVAPDSQAAHFNLGLLLRAAGRAEEAVESLRAAAELDPDDGEAQLQLATALVASGRPEEALPPFAAAARLLPGDDRPWIGGVEALLLLGRHQEALARLEEAHRRMPQQGRLAHALARLLAAGPDPALRDGGRALALAQAVFEASPSVGHAETVALALAELDRCQEAAEWQQRAQEAAAEAGEEALAASLRRPLPGYQAGPPCRPPAGG